jgi:hypothetical protein
LHTHTLNSIDQGRIVRAYYAYLLDAKGIAAEGETDRQQKSGPQSEEAQESPPKETACSLPSTAIWHGLPLLPGFNTSMRMPCVHLSVSTQDYCSVFWWPGTLSLELPPTLGEGVPGHYRVSLWGGYHTMFL